MAQGPYSPSPRPSFAATIKEDREKIQSIVETFRVSLIKKDAATFMTLFLTPDIPWIGVTTDKSLARMTASKPSADLPNPEKLNSSDWRIVLPQSSIDQVLLGLLTGSRLIRHETIESYPDPYQ